MSETAVQWLKISVRDSLCVCFFKVLACTLAGASGSLKRRSRSGALMHNNKVNCEVCTRVCVGVMHICVCLRVCSCR